MKLWREEILEQAHKLSIFNSEQIANSTVCGCFHCLHIFKPKQIKHWTDKGNPKGATPFCPKCHMDTVLGSASEYPVDDIGFLMAMKKHWF